MMRILSYIFYDFVRLKIILVLLFVSSIIYCQEKVCYYNNDPFLIFYLRNHPTLYIDTSEDVVIKRIAYKNFEKNDINFGDDDHDTFRHSIYLFNDREFCGIDNAFADTDNTLLLRYKEIEISRNHDGSIDKINQYSARTNRLIMQHVYKKNNNVIVANDGLRSGVVCTVLVEEGARFIYYHDYQSYNKNPNEPQMILNFIDAENEDLIIDLYSFMPWEHRSRFYFTNGILMRREYINNRIETYTVRSGKGEIIITDTSGKEVERKVLERYVNTAGFLEYEAVMSQSGPGYEYFFMKEAFK